MTLNIFLFEAAYLRQNSTLEHQRSTTSKRSGNSPRSGHLITSVTRHAGKLCAHPLDMRPLVEARYPCRDTADLLAPNSNCV